MLDELPAHSTLKTVYKPQHAAMKKGNSGVCRNCLWRALCAEAYGWSPSTKRSSGVEELMESALLDQVP